MTIEDLEKKIDANFENVLTLREMINAINERIDKQIPYLSEFKDWQTEKWRKLYEESRQELIKKINNEKPKYKLPEFIKGKIEKELEEDMLWYVNRKDGDEIEMLKKIKVNIDLLINL